MGDYTKEEYASKGVAGIGLGLGIAGTALGLLNNNGNGLGKVNEVALATKSNFDLLNQTINCLSNSVAQNTNAIGAITKTVVPRDVICPEVMPRYNSFVVPTTTPTPAA